MSDEDSCPSDKAEAKPKKTDKDSDSSAEVALTSLVVNEDDQCSDDTASKNFSTETDKELLNQIKNDDAGTSSSNNDLSLSELNNDNYYFKLPPSSPDNLSSATAVITLESSPSTSSVDKLNRDFKQEEIAHNSNCEPSTGTDKGKRKKSSPNIDSWYSRTIRDERDSDSDDNEGDDTLRRSHSQSLLTRFTEEQYANTTHAWYRAGRTGTRRRSSLGDVFVAEQAGREVRITCRCDGGRRYLKRLARGGWSCERRLKMLHVIIGGRPEALLFCSDIPQETFREAILGMAGASPCDTIFLRNQSGNAVALTPDLETNTSATAYVVVVQRLDGGACANSEAHSCIRQCARPPPQFLTGEHIARLGLLPQFEIGTEPIGRQTVQGGRILDIRRPSEPHHHIVWGHFSGFSGWEVTDEEIDSMLTSNVDCYQLSDEKILALMFKMFEKLQFFVHFPIPENALRNFLYEVYKHYNEVPFHNFRHSFCVAQMFYAMCMQSHMEMRLSDINILILYVSCICHDLDHPGFNNIYQINARTDLALRYNDISPLENHHCSVAFRILQLHDCNIFRNFSVEDFRTIRDGMIRCILATDMARHNEILAQFMEIGLPLDIENKVHLNLLTMVIIKVADISNEVRPLPVAEPWLDRLLQEFFAQSDLERSLGLPITPFMDRERVTKPTSQCAFIGLVLLPLFEALVHHYPELEDLLIRPARHALEHYTALAAELVSSPSESVASNQVAAAPNAPAPAPARANPDDLAVAGPSGLQRNASLDNDVAPGSPGSFAQRCPETEVECSEKALKFKIATEGSFDRRSYPTSRKGSREAGLSTAELIRALHYASSPSPPPLEEDESQQELEVTPQLPPVGAIPDEIEVVVTEQPMPAALDAPSTSKTKSPRKSTCPAKQSEKSSSSTFQKAIMSRLRNFTEKISFRDSPPSSPSKNHRHGKSHKEHTI